MLAQLRRHTPGYRIATRWRSHGSEATLSGRGQWWHKKALLKDPAITVEQVAKRLGVAPSTLYRYLPGGRSATDAYRAELLGLA
jgi:transcriptional regulator with XRE-family HTH domain